METSKKDFTRWAKALQGSTKGTEFKVRGSIGVYDIYKYIRKNKWYDIGRPVKEHEFYSIIRGINKLMAKELAEGHSVTFPHKMGTLELQKYHVGVNIVDGKLKNTYPIDWSKTLRLWYEDEEAYRDRVLLRNECPWKYHIYYNKFRANYENKCFYQFVPNSFINRELAQNINQGKVDTYFTH